MRKDAISRPSVRHMTVYDVPVSVIFITVHFLPRLVGKRKPICISTLKAWLTCERDIFLVGTGGPFYVHTLQAAYTLSMASSSSWLSMPASVKKVFISRMFLTYPFYFGIFLTYPFLHFVVPERLSGRGTLNSVRGFAGRIEMHNLTTCIATRLSLRRCDPTFHKPLFALRSGWAFTIYENFWEGRCTRRRPYCSQTFLPSEIGPRWRTWPRMPSTCCACQGTCPL